MRTRRNRVIAFERPGVPLRLEEQQLPQPARGGAQVRVAMAGICGSDVHRLAGDLPAPPRPITLGHEGVGTVEALGAGFESDSCGAPLEVGDMLYWTTLSSCNRCHACVVLNDPVRCTSYSWPVPADEPSPAAFQDVATINILTACARVPPGVDSDALIAFGCAMPTALGGLRRVGGIRPGDSVVIQGCGPVGLASTVLASLSLAEKVIVIGGPTGRLNTARRLGADEVVQLDGTSAEERRTAVLDLTEGRGADLLVEAAGQTSAFEEGLALLGPAGRYLVMGLYSGLGAIPFDPVRLNNANQVIVGSLGYHPQDLCQAVGLACRLGEARGLGDLVTDRFDLTRTEEGIRFSARGDAIKCAVTPGAP